MKHYGTVVLTLESIIAETRKKEESRQLQENKKIKNKKRIKKIKINDLEIKNTSQKILIARQIQKDRSLRLYHELRKNILRSILSTYHNSGFFWEHYEDQEGKGTRGHPFSGWTALLINIMAEF